MTLTLQAGRPQQGATPTTQSSALQGCLLSLSAQGVNQPVTAFQMPTVEETSQAPEKGHRNQM